MRKALISAALAVLLAGCSPRIIETVRVEYRDRVRVDTTYVHDSTWVKEYIKGDTVRVTEFRDRYVYQYRYLRDTVAVHDTMTVQTVKEVKVEAPIPPGKRMKIRAFWWLVAACGGLLIWTFRKPILALLRRVI